MMKKLSVLVPSYNFEKYLIECIDSIFKQKTNFDFDVIVRDDGSKDNSKKILNYLKNKYPSLIVLDGTTNIGGYQNIKLLYESTKSEYIAYLDGDDIFGDDNKLQRQVDFLDSHPNYVMCFTGCRHLFEDGTIFPNDSRVICSVLDVITTEDLLDKNYSGFGRMFRNIPNIFKKEYENLPYVDWPMAYELSKYGLIHYDEFFGGLYRISDDGIYSKQSEEEKIKGADLVRYAINKNYLNEKCKTITIIDSFVSNLSVLEKLKKTIKSFKEHDHIILLVSNTVPPEDLINSVDYFLYNHENKLFSESYESSNKVNLWKSYDNIVINEITEELQRHGLSVLCNLFNCLDLAKSLGFTHFQRVEVDDLYSEKGHEHIKNVPILCKEKNKKSLFYINEGKDVSFHYFFSEIDFFIDNFQRINSEESYKEFLKQNNFGNTFKPVEVYLHANLKNSNKNYVLLKNGEEEMNLDFAGTIWNTESSQSTLPSYYEGCTTKIYNVKGQDIKVVLSFNYTNKEINRKIVVVFDDHQQIIDHTLINKGYYYHTFNNPIKEIKVYDVVGDRHLFDVENKNIEDYIEFK
jgi:glycosyltransferase involved in cell wall biosynthesis